jgi:hypothetical protein
MEKIEDAGRTVSKWRHPIVYSYREKAWRKHGPLLSLSCIERHWLARGARHHGLQRALKHEERFLVRRYIDSCTFR